MYKALSSCPHSACKNPPCVLTPLIYFPRCCHLGADPSAADGAVSCDSAVFGSMCVKSVSRSDICDNQDPARLYCLQPEASAS